MASLNEFLSFLLKKYSKNDLINFFNINPKTLEGLLKKQNVNSLDLARIKNKLSIHDGFFYKENHQYYLLNTDWVVQSIKFVENNIIENINPNLVYQNKLTLLLMKYKTVENLCKEIHIGLSTYYRTFNPKHKLTEQIKNRIKKA